MKMSNDELVDFENDIARFDGILKLGKEGPWEDKAINIYNHVKKVKWYHYNVQSLVTHRLCMIGRANKIGFWEFFLNESRTVRKDKKACLDLMKKVMIYADVKETQMMPLHKSNKGPKTHGEYTLVIFGDDFGDYLKELVDGDIPGLSKQDIDECLKFFNQKNPRIISMDTLLRRCSLYKGQFMPFATNSFLKFS